MDIDFSRIKGSENINDRYLRRCIRELKKWNAPLEGWFLKGLLMSLKMMMQIVFQAVKSAGVGKLGMNTIWFIKIISMLSLLDASVPELWKVTS